MHHEEAAYRLMTYARADNKPIPAQLEDEIRKSLFFAEFYPEQCVGKFANCKSTTDILQKFRELIRETKMSKCAKNAYQAMTA